MPLSHRHKRKKNRDFLMLPDKFVAENHLKWLDLVFRHHTKITDLSEVEMRFMLFAYDYEFWTITKISEDYGRSRNKLYQRIILPLKQRDYIIPYFNQGNSSRVVDGHLEIKYGQAARLSLSKKGRHAVQRFYKMVSGEEQISYALDPRLKTS